MTQLFPELAAVWLPGVCARLAGVAVPSDGSLLFSDDEHGVIYRVEYEQSR